MRIILILLIFALPISAHSSEQDKYSLIMKIVSMQEIDKSIENNTTLYAEELKRLNRIKPDKLEVFIRDYKAALLALYIDSYNQLTLGDLKRLAKFYESDEGKWQINIRHKINNYHDKYNGLLQKDFNNRLHKLANENP